MWPCWVWQPVLCVAVAWADVEDVRVIPEETKEQPPQGPMEKLASLDKGAEVDDYHFNIPANYCMLASGMWNTLYALTGGPSKITVGHADCQEMKAVLEVT